MTTTLRTAVQGDTADVRTLTLDGVDLSNAVSARLIVKRGDVDESLDAVLTATGCTVELGDWLGPLTLTSREETWQAEVEVTFPAGVLTWPQTGPATIRVRADLD